MRYRAEGLLGLYRGFGLSVVTFVPSSALWWGAYGGYQKLIWQQLDGLWDNPAVITELTAGGSISGGGGPDGRGSGSSDGSGSSGSGAKRPTSQVQFLAASTPVLRGWFPSNSQFLGRCVACISQAQHRP